METEIQMALIQEPELKGGKVWGKRGLRDWERADLILLVISMVTIFTNAGKNTTVQNSK